MMESELKRETDKKLEKYKKMNKDVKKKQILFVGSSLMEMFPVEEFVQERKLPFIVYNRGIGGYKTEDLLNAMDICIYELNPRRIFINIGTNDLSDSSISLEDMIGNYDKILSEIKSHIPSVELYVMAYYPVNYDVATEEMKECLKIRSNEKILLANEKVEKLAHKHKAKYIDVNYHLKDAKGALKEEYTIEGMHIKREGYWAIFDDVLQYIQEAAWN